MKPLYSEQSRDPNKCSLYGGVHPRGVRYVHADMCLNYNVHILKLTSQISLTFDSLIRPSLNFSSKFFRFVDMLKKTDYIIIIMCTLWLQLATDWNLAISLKHYSHDWETNKTLLTWYSVKFFGIWDHWPLWTFARPGVQISYHLPVSIQSLLVELSC